MIQSEAVFFIRILRGSIIFFHISRDLGHYPLVLAGKQMYQRGVNKFRKKQKNVVKNYIFLDTDQNQIKGMSIDFNLHQVVNAVLLQWGSQTIFNRMHFPHNFLHQDWDVLYSVTIDIMMSL